ncbi:MAG: S9 family peptidase [Thermoanaerobaculia bacterium]
MRTFLLVFLVATSSFAAQSRDAVIDQTIATLLRVQTFEQAAISPDGSRVAYVKTVRAANGQKTGETGIYISPGSRVTASTKKAAEPAEEAHIAWSPDSRQIAFVSDASGGQQLYVAFADGSKVRAVTAAKGAFATPRWSPDGKSIAVLFIENASRKGGALEAMTPPAGDIEMQVEEQRIAIVDPATKSLQFATPSDMYIYDYDWSPDGASFVAEAAFGSGENNYWVAQLWRFDRGDIKGRSIYKPALQIANPRWSPDGKSIAFIEGLMSDEGQTGGDIHVMPAGGGEARNLTDRMPFSATSLQWTESGSILFGEIINGLSGFALLDGTSVKQLWTGEGKVYTRYVVGVSAARDGVTTAAIRESFQRAPEVVTGTIGQWKQLTHANDNVQPLWGRSENLNWTSDAYRVQGWLLYPKETSKALPMIVQVHGGPSSAVVSSWPLLNTAALVASGYAVFLPNPRGSYGQGEAFVQANVKDFGYGDLRDILRGVDAVVATGKIDKDRAGIWGWSYGGYMTMWAVTQTRRFRAAVAGAGIVNWESYYGQNSIDQWMVPFFGASVYDDPHIYRRSSPIEFIRSVKTPTLVLVGDRDGEVPAPQSFEFWHALRTLGVKTKLVVYPNEGHRINQPEHRRDIAKRLVMWFDENL